MDKKLMIYPFNRRTSVIARHAESLKGYILTAIVSPDNYGYRGKDISYVDGGEFADVTISSSFQDGLSQCDCVLFCNTNFFMNLDYYETKIADAMSHGKEVIMTRELANDFIKNKKYISEDIMVLGNNLIKKKLSYHNSKCVHDIPVPVVTIVSVGEFCNGFNCQLAMSNNFESDGYKVSKITSNSLGKLFDFHMLPNYIYKSNLSYEDKIVNFNDFVLSIIKKEDPDVILLEIEDPILPYNDRITNHFGAIPAIITKSVQSDISILSLYYSDYDETYLNQLKLFCRYALNTEINYINISNESMTIKEISSINPIQYITVDLATVLHAINSDYKVNDDIFFSVYDTSSINAVYFDMVEKLTQNRDILRIW